MTLARTWLPWALLSLVAAGCGSAPTASPRSAAVFSNLRRGQLPKRGRPALPADGRGAALDGPAPASGLFVERALERRGHQLGTGGRPEALLETLRARHGTVALLEVRPGDVVFFALAGRGCGDHVALVESVESGGRIGFRESRDGRLRVSYAHPGRPRVRRDEGGRVLNTFLRPKRQDDPPEARHFAGELLCAVVRATEPRRAGERLHATR